MRIYRLILIITLLLAAGVVGACDALGGDGGDGNTSTASGEGAESPEDAVRLQLEATNDGDMKIANSYTCAANRLSDEELSSQEEQLNQQPGMHADIDFSEVQYDVNQQDDTTAIVTLTGSISGTIGGETGQIPAETIFPQGIRVIKEGDSWFVCERQAEATAAP